MGTYGGILLTFKEAGYLCFHAGWSTQPGDQLYERVALNNVESHLHTGAYRPASENGLGGIDWGWEMENDINGPFPTKKSRTDTNPKNTLLDPFMWFDPVWATRKSLEWAKANPTQPFRPWSYGYSGAPRTAASISLPTVKEAIGPLSSLYSEQNSPYWRMVNANMPVGDLPKPPLVYYSRLPAPVLKLNDAYKEGRVNQLQRILAENGWFDLSNGKTFDNYYGPRVVAGVSKAQTLLRDLGLWDGPVDGKVYSVELFTLWDSLLEFDFYTLWS